MVWVSGCYKCNSSKTNWDVSELEDVHPSFVFLNSSYDIDCIDYYLFQKIKIWKKKMLPSTLDMVPSPSTWNPRPSTLDPRVKGN